MYFLSAGLASSLSAAITCPLDVAKTRIQVQARQEKGNNGITQLKYRNTLHALKEIVREEGYSALMRGIKPRILWMAGGTTVTMVACTLYFFFMYTDTNACLDEELKAIANKF